MTPKTISAWIDQLRGMLDDPLVNCEKAVRDVVNCELDALAPAAARGGGPAYS
jgi:hypothetical protein